MAFKMNPGRGPMQRTGRGIPMAFQSPLNQTADAEKKKAEKGAKRDSERVAREKMKDRAVKGGRGPKMEKEMKGPKMDKNMKGPKMEKDMRGPKQSKDLMDGDKLPSYTENTTTNTNKSSGSGSSSKSSSTSSSSEKRPSFESTYGEAQKKKYGSFAAYKKAAIAFNKAQKNKNKSKPKASKQESSSSTTETKTKKVSLGKETMNQVKASGKEKKANARSKRNAEINAATIAAKRDSTNTSNRLRKRVTNDGKKPLKESSARGITNASNAAARKRLGQTVSSKEAQAMFPASQGPKGGKQSGTQGGVFSDEDLN